MFQIGKMFYQNSLMKLYPTNYSKKKLNMATNEVSVGSVWKVSLLILCIFLCCIVKYVKRRVNQQKAGWRKDNLE